MSNVELRALLLWPTRFVYILAVICAVVLLIVDSPVSGYVSGYWSIPITRSIVEAAPLLLVGIACLAWLVMDRPAAADLIPQALIAVAFILWGIDLLMPTGQWATFFGAVVIAIYVFDLAWLMERSLRKKSGSRTEATAGAVASADRLSAEAGERDSRNVSDGVNQTEARFGSTNN